MTTTFVPQYGSLREKIAAEKAARNARYYEFRSWTTEAHEAGMVAGNAVQCTPMYIQGYEPIADGVCGFAWVTIRPGNSSFANWAKKAGVASKAYGGGVQVWVGQFNQSMTRKEAYARAYAEVLRAHGVTAYSGSRMD